MSAFLELLHHLYVNKNRITFAAAACSVLLNCISPAIAQKLDKSDPGAHKTVLFSEWISQPESIRQFADAVHRNTLQKAKEPQTFLAEPSDSQKSIIYQKISDAMINALRAQSDINQDRISVAVTKAIEENKTFAAFDESNKNLLNTLFAVMIIQIVLVVCSVLLMVSGYCVYRKTILPHKNYAMPQDPDPSSQDPDPSSQDPDPSSQDLIFAALERDLRCFMRDGERK